jgi:phospholipase/lecithinase/hemolysin
MPADIYPKRVTTRKITAGERTMADEVAVLDAVDPAELVGLLQDLIAIPSITGSEAESQAQQVWAGYGAALRRERMIWSRPPATEVI